MQKILNFAQGTLVINDEARAGYLKLKPNFSHMAIGAGLVTTAILFQHQLMLQFNLPALFAIVFFNLLFLFLIFPLKGTLRRKTVLLIGGNQVGFFWYAIQLLLEDTILILNTETFRTVFLVAKPLLDFVWVVAVWSVSLSLMSQHRIKTER
jgi:hypothetical protein